MIASAKNIAAGGVGFVYLADTLPGFLLKARAPAPRAMADGNEDSW